MRIPVETRSIPWIVFLISVATLGGAYLFQYVGGLAPCELCYWQRIPYAVGIPLSALAIVAGRTTNIGLTPLTLMTICALTFAVSAGLGLYHAGVEYKWWEGPSACTGAGAIPMTLEDLASGLAAPSIVRCDEIPWSLFGISLAGYNFLISLLLTGLCLLPLYRYRHPADTALDQ